MKALVEWDITRNAHGVLLYRSRWHFAWWEKLLLVGVLSCIFLAVAFKVG